MFGPLKMSCRLSFLADFAQEFSGITAAKFLSVVKQDTVQRQKFPLTNKKSAIESNSVLKNVAFSIRCCKL